MFDLNKNAGGTLLIFITIKLELKWNCAITKIYGLHNLWAINFEKETSSSLKRF
jgi:hypothetical protein